MKRVLLLAHWLLIAGATSLPAADLLPLHTGNYWIYKRQGGFDSFTIRVGQPALIGGQVYHRLIGYVSEPVWVRQIADGLYYRNEEVGQDVLLTSFVIVRRGWFDAPLRPCEQVGQVMRRKVPYEGPSGRFDGVVKIGYATLNCADAGVEEETFLENLGMLQRTSTTIAGPVRYDLVAASVGGFRLNERPGSSLSLSVSPEPGGEKLKATLRLSVDSDRPFTLVHPTSQEFDLQLRDSEGRPVWQWSEGRFFLTVITEKKVDQLLVHTVEVPLVDGSGKRLPRGTYTLEAWLTAGESGRQFATAVELQIEE